MKTLKIYICLALGLLLPALLAGCGETEDPFQVMFGAPYVSKERVAEYAATLALDTEVPITYTGFSFGSDGMDAVTYGASAMTITAKLVAGEIDVMVLDPAEAGRYARSGMFCDLRDIFTEEELAPYEDRLIDFDCMDINGEPTGEKTELCGLDISGREPITYALGSENYGVYIVCNTADLDTAKEVFWTIVEDSGE